MADLREAIFQIDEQDRSQQQEQLKKKGWSDEKVQSQEPRCVLHCYFSMFVAIFMYCFNTFTWFVVFGLVDAAGAFQAVNVWKAGFRI
jgi:hypothetical protein